ncbi:MAG: D-alanine--D-alanine ligase [Peptococcaceae bacterium]|jgi:D-alanine-D-alanine ligase|nr:D-alanine--D-alanine ligase [Peptococcaceae bacterium]
MREGLARPVCVAVLFGGQSGEHEVSLESAKSLLGVLRQQDYTLRTIGISREGQWFWGVTPQEMQTQGFPAGGRQVTILLDPRQPRFLALDGQALEDDGQVDLVFPMLHGSYGEDGTLQGLLEMSGWPYVGSGVLGSALGMDKDRMKAVLVHAGLPVAEYLTFRRWQIRQDAERVIQRIEESLDYPCFVKPANMGSSVGVNKAHGREELAEALQTAALYDTKIVVEQAVIGREIEVSVLGNDQPQASIPGEILPAREFYDYEAKYADVSSRLRIPAELPAEVVAELQEAATRVYQAVDADGLSRVDFFVTPDNRIVVNEINTLPGFTTISMYTKLWAASGLPYEDLVDQLISLALARFREQRDRRLKHEAKKR